MSTTEGTTRGATPGPTLSTAHREDPRTVELARRIEELEALDDAGFGRFTAWDWSLCIAFSVVLPLLAIWWYAA